MTGRSTDSGWSPYVAGALAGSLTDRSYRLETVPPTWAQQFGPNPWRRGLRFEKRRL